MSKICPFCNICDYYPDHGDTKCVHCHIYDIQVEYQQKINQLNKEAQQKILEQIAKIQDFKEQLDEIENDSTIYDEITINAPPIDYIPQPIPKIPPPNDVILNKCGRLVYLNKRWFDRKPAPLCAFCKKPFEDIEKPVFLEMTKQGSKVYHPICILNQNSP